jgi:hypothetical protein
LLFCLVQILICRNSCHLFFLLFIKMQRYDIFLHVVPHSQKTKKMSDFSKLSDWANFSTLFFFKSALSLGLPAHYIQRWKILCSVFRPKSSSPSFRKLRGRKIEYKILLDLAFPLTLFYKGFLFYWILLVCYYFVVHASKNIYYLQFYQVPYLLFICYFSQKGIALP